MGQVTSLSFFPLPVHRILKQAELQLCSLEDDKCLSPMFLLALPAHHINPLLEKQNGRRHDDDIWLSK